jgi:hypothetical protein
MTMLSGRRGFRVALMMGSTIWALVGTTQAQPRPDGGTRTEQVQERDGQRDFDFEFGTWKAHVRRLVKPLAGSTTWVELDGTSVVRKVWDGEANMGELDIQGLSGRIQGVTLRLYDPQTRQWSVSFSSRAGGVPGQPLYGRFKDGRGEFFDQETFNGRAIYVRFVFSEIARDTFRFEQAFSDDGGKSWEVNWIATFRRS